MCMEDREIIDLFFKRDEEGILRLEEQYKAYCGKIASQILSKRIVRKLHEMQRLIVLRCLGRRREPVILLRKVLRN